LYGAWTGAPGAPTFIIYGHYDVQPPDPLELWHTPPFEPTMRDGRLYARGASDVKGSTTIAVEAVAAFLAVSKRCPVNVKFFLEGEEEIGSPSLRRIVERHRHLLEADAMISADGGRASTSVPTVSVGNRGIASLEVKVRTAAKDVHSGRYGGAIRNALHELVALLASLHDAEGRIAVPAFMAEVPQLTAQQRQDTAALPFDQAAFYADIGGSPCGDPAYTARERMTLQPTIEINGMWGGYTGPGSKTVIPCQAQAKITMRLVPGQDPDRAGLAVRQHLEARCRPGVTLAFSEISGGSPAFSLAPDHPLLAAAMTVVERTSGRRPIPTRGGGTLPITAIFKEMLGLDTLAFGFAMPDEDIHAPNEFFRISSLHEGLTAWPLLLAELARYQPGDFRKRSAGELGESRS
jgi:acetylornithine deacetylase/succinyl-diaminopimelate desuccinylase-like protein